MTQLPDPLVLAAFLAVVALVPFLAIMVTSFVKLAIVLSLVRNALGVQQIPPNMAIYGLAIILSVYIMAPVGYAIAEGIRGLNVDLSTSEGVMMALETGSEPLREFLMRHTSAAQREFFLHTATRLWPAEMTETLTADSYFILAPAFTVSELTLAFQIGFLLYLPFVVIDLIVSNILLAMGMMMVSPMTISLPLKLFLFVMVDGWSRLIEGLVLSYA
ncbi:type III secretion system export apparatus subunit SctR [Telmatospirillum sp. J64-1]|uniref:type III secretion system export apparatus subunit SctR n=1 Tax=Telmatospirillum sp. J64-1 TaxID=2502183 RepID=UPI00115EAE69|nr:type III secretion system export apparatus subunit SctR [Telmatospirillum sp. J64-1]